MITFYFGEKEGDTPKLLNCSKSVKNYKYRSEQQPTKHYLKYSKLLKIVYTTYLFIYNTNQ